MEENTNQEVTENTEVTEQTEGEAAVSKRPKKLTKKIDGAKVVIQVIDGEKGEMVFDTAELTEAIQKQLIPFGAGHKLGDSAAGRSGKDAEEAITKTWEGMLKGEWSVRVPAAPKVAISDIASNLAKMSPEEQAQAKALLASMGINVG